MSSRPRFVVIRRESSSVKYFGKTSYGIEKGLSPVGDNPFFVFSVAILRQKGLAIPGHQLDQDSERHPEVLFSPPAPLDTEIIHANLTI